MNTCGKVEAQLCVLVIIVITHAKKENPQHRNRKYPSPELTVPQMYYSFQFFDSRKSFSRDSGNGAQRSYASVEKLHTFLCSQ